MTLLISMMWMWLLGAFGLGLVAGAVSGGAGPGPGSGGARIGQWTVVGLGVVGAGASLAGVLAGREALWLDIALLLALAYAAGSLAGVMVGMVSAGRDEIAVAGMNAPVPYAAPVVTPVATPLAQPVAAVAALTIPETSESGPIPALASEVTVAKPPKKPKKAAPAKPQAPATDAISKPARRRKPKA